MNKKLFRQALVAGLKRSIHFNTVTSRGNAAFAAEVGKLLKRGGFKVLYQKIKVNGRLFVNVIGTKNPRSSAAPLLLCSHLDTVPPGDPKKWTRTGGDPWNAAARNGRVYGLGAADDKGPLIAMIHAALAFPAERLKRPLMVMGTFGEESGMGGARLFVRSWKGQKPCMALVGEPTNLGITYRHKGIGVMEIELESRRVIASSGGFKVIKKTFRGKQGHSSRPWLGDNALDKAVPFLKKIRAAHADAMLVSLEGGHAANLIPGEAELTLVRSAGSEASSPGKNQTAVFPIGAFLDCHEAVQSVLKKLQGRKDASFHPSTVTSNFGIARVNKNILSLTFDFRLLPGIETKKIAAALHKRLSKKLSRHKDIRWRLRIERDNPPLDMDLNHPLPQFGRRLLRTNRLPQELTVKPACTEAGIYHSWGMPAVIFGPGESAGNIHAPNESIKISQLEKAVEFYASVIHEVCINPTVIPAIFRRESKH